MTAPKQPKMKPSERRKARQAENEKEHEARHAVLKGKTPGQRRYINGLRDYGTIIVTGPAGTGKTYCAGTYGAQLYLAGQIKQFILVRPAVEAGEEKHGFLPGDIFKKLAPWAEPLLAVLRKRLGTVKVASMIASGEIRVEPFTYMRGLSWDDAFVILDEAQNTTIPQMKLFTTRIGERCKVIIDGDVKQSDLENRDIYNGLSAVTEIALDRRMEDTILITLTNEDIVRGPVCARWVAAWDDFEATDTLMARVEAETGGFTP